MTCAEELETAHLYSTFKEPLSTKGSMGSCSRVQVLECVVGIQYCEVKILMIVYNTQLFNDVPGVRYTEI